MEDDEYYSGHGIGAAEGRVSKDTDPDLFARTLLPAHQDDSLEYRPSHMQFRFRFCHVLAIYGYHFRKVCEKNMV